MHHKNLCIDTKNSSIVDDIWFVSASGPADGIPFLRVSQPCFGFSSNVQTCIKGPGAAGAGDVDGGAGAVADSARIQMPGAAGAVAVECHRLPARRGAAGARLAHHACSRMERDQESSRRQER